jgi:hypothetical protein
MREWSPAASTSLALASVGVLIGSLIGAWVTFDFWETIPLVPCVLGAGSLAGLSLYARRRRFFGSVALGLAVAVATFVATLLITLARWEG